MFGFADTFITTEADIGSCLVDTLMPASSVTRKALTKFISTLQAVDGKKTYYAAALEKASDYQFSVPEKLNQS